MSDTLGRLNVLRLMIGISMVAMPILYLVGGNVMALYVVVFVVYWCYGTQLSVNAATAADFWGTKNAGINYGMLFTAWGFAGYFGAKIRRHHVRQVPQLSDGVLHGRGSGLGGADLRVPGKASEARLVDSPAPDSKGPAQFV
jgi:hypothetical protein